MSIWCKLFGHKPHSGYAGGGQYFRASSGAVDGIGREHWRLYAECERCEKQYHIGNVRGPLRDW